MAGSARSRSNPWVLPMLVGSLATLAVVAVFWFLLGRPDAGPAAVSEPTADAESPVSAEPVEQAPSSSADVNQAPLDPTYVERRDPDDPLAAGAVDAPVVMVIFSDYQCPYCGAWSADTLPAMMEYVDRGELRLEWRDLNMYGPPSERGSLAGYAAGLQGKFWEFHEQLFPDGAVRAEADLNHEAMVQLATDLELDVEQFTADMTSAQAKEQIVVNQQLGTDLGAYSTPSFLIAGEPMVGAQPTEIFVDAIDQALAAR